MISRNVSCHQKIEIFRCQESFRDIIIYPHMKCRWYRTMLNLCSIQHNTAQIQHCPISTPFHMWVDYDVPNWFLTSKIFYGCHFQNGHHNTAQIQHCSTSTTFHMWVVEIFQCRESVRDIIIYPHIKFWWYRTMLNFCGIVAVILKMATSRNCSMSGLNSWHHYLPTYQIVMISDNG
jgi:hypothetical protein